MTQCQSNRLLDLAGCWPNGLRYYFVSIFYICLACGLHFCCVACETQLVLLPVVMSRLDHIGTQTALPGSRIKIRPNGKDTHSN